MGASLFEIAASGNSGYSAICLLHLRYSKARPTERPALTHSPSSHRSQPMPPVLVMHLHYSGIGIGRNLRSSGVEVHGLSSEARAPAALPRVFRRVHLVPHSRDDPEALCQRLLEIRRDYSDSPVIFPTCDADVYFLARFAEQLAPHYRLPPGREALPQLMDKLNLANMAERLSVPVPKTMTCTCERDVLEVGLSLRFRSSSSRVARTNGTKKVFWIALAPARRSCQTPGELVTEYRHLAIVSAEILVQEYVPGEDSDIVVCCCYIDERGQLLGHFTGRKLRQSPPLFGTGCLLEAASVPEIVSLSQRLLQGSGYSGIAEVEFKRDPASGRYMLIEVNTRHWDQHQLGTLVGVNLTWIAYQKATGRKPEPCAPKYGRIERAPRWIAEREALFLIVRNAVVEVSGSTKNAVSPFSMFRIALITLIELNRLIRRPFLFSTLSSREPISGMLYCSRLMRELALLARQQGLETR